MHIYGSITALVTPMFPNGDIDWTAYKNLIDWQISQGTNAIISVGTTGESPTVDMHEHMQLIECAVKHAAKRVPVIAGTGGNSTRETIELTAFAKDVGADAALQVVPYYNKPGQEGIYQHYKAVCQEVNIPTILYNVPGRTVADMQQATVLRLAEIPNIIGIKDATGNFERGCRLIHATQEVRPDFYVYSGDDAAAAGLMLMGAMGNMSVSANVLPSTFAHLCQAAIAGDAATTKALQHQLLELNEVMFIEANPIPVKYALYLMGKIQAGIRLPLTLLQAEYQAKVRQALQNLGIELKILDSTV